jgi:hypothetical protein
MTNKNVEELDRADKDRWIVRYPIPSGDQKSESFHPSFSSAYMFAKEKARELEGKIDIQIYRETNTNKPLQYGHFNAFGNYEPV